MQKSSLSPYKDNKAKVLLISALSKTIKQLVNNAKTSKQMWEVLQAEFEFSDYVSVGRAIREFYNFEYSAGANMDQHITDMKQLWLEINNKWAGSAASKKRCSGATHCGCATRDRVSQLEFAHALLLSVADTHEALVLSYRGRKDDVTLDEICNALRAAYKPEKKRKHDDVNSLVSGQLGSTPSSGKRCYICRSTEHEAAGHPGYDPSYKRRKDKEKGKAPPQKPRSAEELYRGKLPQYW